MGLTHPHKIWNLGKAVSHSLPLASPKQYGFLPFELRFKKSIMPVLMHQKRITFGNMQTKHSHSRRSFIPNIIYRPLYSASLDMQVWCCLSARALREIDAAGGFDEYLINTSEAKLGDDKLALVYRKKVMEARARQSDSSQAEMIKILKEKYGDEYLQKVEQTRLY